MGSLNRSNKQKVHPNSWHNNSAWNLSRKKSGKIKASKSAKKSNWRKFRISKNSKNSCRTNKNSKSKNNSRKNVFSKPKSNWQKSKNASSSACYKIKRQTKSWRKSQKRKFSPTKSMNSTSQAKIFSLTKKRKNLLKSGSSTNPSTATNSMNTWKNSNKPNSKNPETNRPVNLNSTLPHKKSTSIIVLCSTTFCKNKKNWKNRKKSTKPTKSRSSKKKAKSTLKTWK